MRKSVHPKSKSVAGMSRGSAYISPKHGRKGLKHAARLRKAIPRGVYHLKK